MGETVLNIISTFSLLLALGVAIETTVFDADITISVELTANTGGDGPPPPPPPQY